MGQRPAKKAFWQAFALSCEPLDWLHCRNCADCDDMLCHGKLQVYVAAHGRAVRH